MTVIPCESDDQFLLSYLEGAPNQLVNAKLQRIMEIQFLLNYCRDGPSESYNTRRRTIMQTIREDLNERIEYGRSELLQVLHIK
jgi:hypothetical protein